MFASHSVITAHYWGSQGRNASRAESRPRRSAAAYWLLPGQLVVSCPFSHGQGHPLRDGPSDEGSSSVEVPPAQVCQVDSDTDYGK